MEGVVVEAVGQGLERVVEGYLGACGVGRGKQLLQSPVRSELGPGTSVSAPMLGVIP